MPQIVHKSEVSDKSWDLLKRVYDSANDGYLVLQVRDKRLVIQPLSRWLEDKAKR